MESQAEYWNIDPQAGQLLQALIFTHQPKQILEIGTSNGYSAILMASIAKQYGGHITTIEFFQKRIDLAKENIEKENLLKYIDIIQGDAMTILKTLDIPFDFFFIDATKREYADFFKECMRLANPNAIIVADNTVSHRDKLDSFFEEIKKEKNIDILELEIGTGLVIIKKQK
jgi:predicted O-methyltransferase YrrM